MKRLSNGRYLKERQLGPYMEHYCLQRLSPMLDDFQQWKVPQGKATRSLYGALLLAKAISDA
jgi:hypothetical protein